MGGLERRRRGARPGLAVALLATVLAQADVAIAEQRRSPSGELSVRARSWREADGFRATLALVRGEEEVWSRELALDLGEVRVSNAGVVAGFGYSHGRRSGRGTLEVFAFDVAGERVLAHGAARSPWRFHGGPAGSPSGAAVAIHADEVVVWVRDAEARGTPPEFRPDGNAWWVFGLDTRSFEVVFPETPEASGAHGFLVLDALAVEPTGLTLSHWFAASEANGLYDAIFALHDARGRIVWSDDRPRYFRSRRGEAYERELVEWLHEHGAIAPGRAAGTFEVLQTRAQAIATYEVTGSETDGWRAERLDRRAAPVARLVRDGGAGWR